MLDVSRYLIVLYLKIIENSFCTLLCASERRAVLTSVDLENVWKPCIIAASICSLDQDGPQLTYKPLLAYDCIRSLAQWYF